jgi:hypothetical protein
LEAGLFSSRNHEQTYEPRVAISTLGAIEDSISKCTFLQMTYTAENPARRWQRRARSTPTSRTAPPPRPPRHVPCTHDNRMAGRQMSCRQQTAPPQSRCSKDVTAHPHRPRARPGCTCPVPACSAQPLPGKRRFSSPLRNGIFSVKDKCLSIMEDVGKLDNIQVGFIHYQIIRFCQATGLQYLNGHV